MRWLRAAAAIVTFVVVVVAVAFPTDEIARWAIARFTPPTGPVLVFRRAVLRPWGLRLDDLAVRRRDGTAIVSVDWFRFRPSLWGFVHDRTGRPWSLATAVCAGRIDATVRADAAATLVDLEWRDLDLGNCPPLAPARLTLAGQAAGTATVRLLPDARPTAVGEVSIRDAMWSLPRPLLDLETIHADSARVRWDLSNSGLILDAFDLRGRELEATGRGTVRLTGSLGRSGLDLRLRVLPGPEAPSGVRLLIDRLPLASGDDPLARSLVVTGTIDAPQVAR